MKRDQIKLGGIYHNGKTGRFYAEREIIGVGPEFLLYSGQTDTDCIRYQTIKGLHSGTMGNMTRTSFASWAKGEVKEREGTE